MPFSVELICFFFLLFSELYKQESSDLRNDESDASSDSESEELCIKRVSCAYCLFCLRMTIIFCNLSSVLLVTSEAVSDNLH